MKKSYLTFAPLGLCILTALAPACRLGDDNPEDALKAQGAANASDATFTVIDMSDGVCENPRCFKSSSRQRTMSPRRTCSEKNVRGGNMSDG